MVYATDAGNGLWLADTGSGRSVLLARPSGNDDDVRWDDPVWTADNWIVFVVTETMEGCRRTRVDRIRPDGSRRSKVDDGGGDCTPDGMAVVGDRPPRRTRRPVV